MDFRGLGQVDAATASPGSQSPARVKVVWPPSGGKGNSNLCVCVSVSVLQYDPGRSAEKIEK